jgi:hypothetical protein
MLATTCREKMIKNSRGLARIELDESSLPQLNPVFKCMQQCEVTYRSCFMLSTGVYCGVADVCSSSSSGATDGLGGGQRRRGTTMNLRRIMGFFLIVRLDTQPLNAEMQFTACSRRRDLDRAVEACQIQDIAKDVASF